MVCLGGGGGDRQAEIVTRPWGPSSVIQVAWR
jgi:hypothetical protein